MVDVTGGPKIQESLHFGFVNCDRAEYLEELRCKLKNLESYGYYVVSIDLAFGYIVLTLPNPAIDFCEYKKQRDFVVSKIKEIVTDIGE